MADRVAVVGGGYAGMAAAVRLAQAGIPVTVFESGPVLGGRARRITAQGHELDNGQHILIGAYSALFGLMQAVGVPSDAVLRLPLELRYAGGFALRSLWLPAPLGLLGGLLLARKIPLRERLGAVRFMHAMRRQRFALARDVPVTALLESHGQNGRIARYLWDALCISALNTPPAQASARIFLAVLRDTLAAGAEASDVLLPRVDLSKLFPEPAAAFVAARGGDVRLRARIDSLDALKGYSAIIVAVGPHQLKTLLPDTLPSYTYQPIYTCYLQYPETTRLPFPMLGLSDGLVQWVFDRGALNGEKGRLACVISARGAHQEMPLEAICAACSRELAAAIPGLGEPLWSRAIAEKRATITCAVGLQRPPAEIEGVVLAGDYTDPDYPPTLEAAVRSGLRAAERVRNRGQRNRGQSPISYPVEPA